MGNICKTSRKRRRKSERAIERDDGEKEREIATTISRDRKRESMEGR